MGSKPYTSRIPILSNNMSTNSKITSLFQAGPRKRHCQTPVVVSKASNHQPTALPPNPTPFFTRDKSEEIRVPKRRKRIMAKDAQGCATTGATTATQADGPRQNVFNACSRFRERNGRWPNRISGRNPATRAMYLLNHWTTQTSCVENTFAVRLRNFSPPCR